MFAGGVVPEIPASNTYISDEYMKAVYDDEELREFASKDTGKEIEDDDVETEDESPDAAHRSAHAIGSFAIMAMLGLLF
jgi:hypothetical protein